MFHYSRRFVKAVIPDMRFSFLKNNSDGFTLLEMVIVTGLFGILAVSATGLLATGLKAQKSAGAVHEVLQNVWYAEGQLAQKIIFSPCKPFGASGCGVSLADGAYSDFRIQDGEGQTVRYFLGSCGASANAICEESGAATTPLTSQKIQVDRLSFVLQGNAKQPQVTIIIGAKSAVASLQRIDMQTTVSMRAITFE